MNTKWIVEYRKFDGVREIESGHTYESAINLASHLEDCGHNDVQVYPENKPPSERRP